MTAEVHPDDRYDQQPSSSWCFVCGAENPCGLHIRFFHDGYHRSLARVSLGDTYPSYPGVAHGGIPATVMDETMGRAVLAEGAAGEHRALEKERFMFTARMEIRYRLPVPLHEEFTARGWVEKDHGRSASVRGEIVLADGRVAVEAAATLVNFPEQQVAGMIEQGDIAWQVYP